MARRQVAIGRIFCGIRPRNPDLTQVVPEVLREKANRQRQSDRVAGGNVVERVDRLSLQESVPRISAKRALTNEETICGCDSS